MAAAAKKPATWEVLAGQKRNGILERIPLHWRLSEKELRQAKSESDVRAVLPVRNAPFANSRSI